MVIKNTKYFRYRSIKIEITLIDVSKLRSLFLIHSGQNHFEAEVQSGTFPTFIPIPLFSMNRNKRTPENLPEFFSRLSYFTKTFLE